MDKKAAVERVRELVADIRGIATDLRCFSNKFEHVSAAIWGKGKTREIARAAYLGGQLAEVFRIAKEQKFNMAAVSHLERWTQIIETE